MKGFFAKTLLLLVALAGLSTSIDVAQLYSGGASLVSEANAVPVSIVKDGVRLTVGRPGQGADFDPAPDLNELVWFDWDPASLADGAVGTWVERAVNDATATLTQTDSSIRPVKTSQGMTFTGLQKFTIGNQTSENVKTTRALVFEFKADYASASSASSQPMVSFQGVSGTATNRFPAVYFNKGSNLLRIYWGSTVPYVEIDAGATNTWHCLITWKEDGAIKVRLDGGTTTTLQVDEIPPRHTGTLTGVLGNNTTTLDWTLGRMMVLQGEPPLARVQAIEGWSMWRRGVQANLPGGHPYFAARPKSAGNRFVNSWAGNNQVYWDTVLDPYWNDNSGALLNAHQGESATAYLATFSEEVFVDNFDTMTVVDEDSAPSAGTWFAPVQFNIGQGVLLRKVSESPSLFAQSSGTLILSLVYQSPNWYGPVFTSVNREGRGRTWNPGVRPTCFEAKFKNSDNSTHSWPSIWLKTSNEMGRGIGVGGAGLRTESYVEIDATELYKNDDNKPHSSYHDHPPFRAYVNRYGGRVESDTVQLSAAGTWPNKPVDFFETPNTYHVFDLCIDHSRVTWILDGLELIRIPSTASQWQPFYILFDVSNWDGDTVNTTTATTTIDYIKVLQGTAYTDIVTPETLREAPTRVASNVLPFKPRTVKAAEPRKVTCPAVPLRCAA